MIFIVELCVQTFRSRDLHYTQGSCHFKCRSATTLHQFVTPSSNSTSITSHPSVTGQGIEKAEPTIEHKYPLLELKTSERTVYGT